MNSKEEVLEFLKANKTLLEDTYHIQKNWALWLICSWRTKRTK